MGTLATPSNRSRKARLKNIRLPHHFFALGADLRRDLLRIAALQLRNEQFHRQSSVITLLGKLLQNLDQRSHAIAWNDPRRLSQKFAWNIRHVIEMHVRELARLQH